MNMVLLQKCDFELTELAGSLGLTASAMPGNEVRLQSCTCPPDMVHWNSMPSRGYQACWHQSYLERTFRNWQQVNTEWGQCNRLLLEIQHKCKPNMGNRTSTFYFSFFLGRRLFVWPHLVLRQLDARGCRRA